ncbi:MAG: hypothetical protein ABJH07_21105 [Sedimentitalea sp.]|uniref:hypothetical protein n=1 Tax=Sedimentitalea sp. TaxID=2048915 RepID=UPI0032643CB1
MLKVGPNTLLRVSPYYEASIAQRAIAFSPHNIVLMPVSYGDPDGEYDRLMNGVSQWPYRFKGRSTSQDLVRPTLL